MVDIEIPIQIQYFYLDVSNWLWISILQLLIKVKNILSASGVIFTIWLSLLTWTKIEFNKEKRHLIGDHIFAEENIYWSINSKQETLVPNTFSFELKKEHNFRVPLIERIWNDFRGTFFGIFCW